MRTTTTSKSTLSTIWNFTIFTRKWWCTKTCIRIESIKTDSTILTWVWSTIINIKLTLISCKTRYSTITNFSMKKRCLWNDCSWYFKRSWCPCYFNNRICSILNTLNLKIIISWRIKLNIFTDGCIRCLNYINWKYWKCSFFENMKKKEKKSELKKEKEKKKKKRKKIRSNPKN